MSMTHENTMGIEELMSLEGRAFVEAAYHRLLCRAADASGLSFYVSEIENGVPKQRVLQALATSPEGRAAAVQLDGLEELIATTAAARKSFFSRAFRTSQAIPASLTNESTSLDHSVTRSYFIERVLTTGNHLFLVGWLNDTSSPLTRVTIEGPEGRRDSFAVAGQHAGGKCRRTPRPDVHRSLKLAPQASVRLGFVIALPERLSDGAQVIVSFEGFEKSSQLLTAESVCRAPTGFAGLLMHSGYALRELAVEVRADAMVQLVDVTHSERRASSQKIVMVDSTLAIAGRSLLVIGWIAAEKDHIREVRLKTGNVAIDATSSVVMVPRPGLVQQPVHLGPQALGFFLVIDDAEVSTSAEATLEVDTARGCQTVRFTPEAAGWAEIVPKLKEFPNLADPLFAAFDRSESLKTLPGYSDDIAWLRREGVAALSSALPRSVNNPLSMIAAIDRVVSFAHGGVLVVGWHYEPQARLMSAQVLCADGSAIEVLDKMFAMPRRDVYESLAQNFPSVGENCGFIFFTATPSSAGETRTLRLELDNGAVEWLQLQAAETIRTGQQLLRALSVSLGDVSKLDSTIFEFFESGFGATIERLSSPPQLGLDAVVEQQFGEAISAPAVSVIVPLYGRCDFLRYQLAHFADDPDFARVDLIYVVDDPRIVTETLTLASHYESLFRIPFRVLHYDENLGFAGANNVGARLARAPILLLLNSDVLPMSHGWISRLKDALDQLPSAGAVGPLLLFADGSVQHAGMQALTDPSLPGFIWNSHPGKGAPWRGGNKPAAQTLLTAACLMLRTDDYRTLGGLDERYLVGDFEDSDLCLKLAQLGKTLWLVPAARLWHLERQSQGIGLVPTRRRLLTFYNGWRYRKRIDRGELPNPLAPGVAKCAS